MEACYKCKKCASDTDCPKDRACMNGNCDDPCYGHKQKCRDEKEGPVECIVQNHQPVCGCIRGFDENPKNICTECKSDNVFK